jgi:peptide-methionine (R)-S-oxide reductase
MSEKAKRTNEQWKELLTDEQYHISREQGTEQPFSGQYWNVTEDGVYHCACCDTALFESFSKFDSGCGWPSFDNAIPGVIEKREDLSIPGRPRTEVVCAHCDAHLGHVFDDGPTASGLRYCINSAVIDLQKEQ